MKNPKSNIAYAKTSQAHWREKQANHSFIIGHPLHQEAQQEANLNHTKVSRCPFHYFWNTLKKHA